MPAPKNFEAGGEMVESADELSNFLRGYDAIVNFGKQCEQSIWF